MENGVTHLQNGTSLTDPYRRSPAIWGRCPLSFIKKYYPEGHVRWDASRMGLAPTLTTQIAGSIPGTKMFASAGGNIQAVSAINSVEKWGGAIEMGVDTDDESASIAQAYPTFRLSGLMSGGGPLWFEGCLAVSSILTNTIGFFMGLAETELWTLAGGVPFNAGDAITNSAAAIGFRKGEDALGVVDTVYSDRATSFTNIGDDEGSISAAYTFVKFGMLYIPDPKGYLGGEYDSNRVIRFFQDNVVLDTAVSKSTLTGLTNLDANAVGPMISLIADASGTATKLYLKWLEVAQLPPYVTL